MGDSTYPSLVRLRCIRTVKYRGVKGMLSNSYIFSLPPYVGISKSTVPMPSSESVEGSRTGGAQDLAERIHQIGPAIDPRINRGFREPP